MKKLIAAMALALTLATPAAAQTAFPQTLPANTVWGRTGIGSGPGQAIPFSILLANLYLGLPAHGVVVSEGGGTPPNGVTCGTALALVGNGLSADPACQALTNAGLANMAAHTLKCNSSGVAGAPQDCNYPIYNVKDPIFGAKCDGLTNDTTSIQNAINATPPGIVLLPGGTCIVTSLTVGQSGVWVLGTGRNASILQVANQSADVVKFFNAVQYNWGKLSDLTINCTGTSTAGYGAEMNNVGAVTFEELQITGCFNGVGVNQVAGGAGRILSVDVSNVVTDGFFVGSTNSVFFDNCTGFQTVAGGGDGFHIVAGGAVHINHSHAQQFTNGIHINPGSGQTVVDVYVADSEMDANTAEGIFIDGTAGGGATARDIYFSNTRTGFANNGSNTAGRGVLIQGAGAQGIAFVGGEDVKNVQEGIYIHGGSNIRIANRLVMGNSVQGSGSFNGINIDGGDKITVIGGASGPYTDGTANNQNFGIALQGSFSGQATIQGVDVRGNVNSVGIAYAATGGLNQLLNNIGYNPIGVSAPSTIGASPFTYTAGPAPETHYLKQTATNSATVTQGGQQIAALVNPSTYYTIELGPNESYVVTWATTAPTTTKFVH